MSWRGRRPSRRRKIAAMRPSLAGAAAPCRPAVSPALSIRAPRSWSIRPMRPSPGLITVTRTASPTPTEYSPAGRGRHAILETPRDQLSDGLSAAPDWASIWTKRRKVCWRGWPEGRGRNGFPRRVMPAMSRSGGFADQTGILSISRVLPICAAAKRRAGRSSDRDRRQGFAHRAARHNPHCRNRPLAPRAEGWASATAVPCAQPRDRHLSAPD